MFNKILKYFTLLYSNRAVYDRYNIRRVLSCRGWFIIEISESAKRLKGGMN